jgi:lysophospholipase L1-like esterase
MKPYLTERMLSASEALAPLAAVAAAHQERLDGSGYPRGLKREALSPTAKILAAADVYEAMLEPRPHREPRTAADAATELRNEARAGRLDPDAVEAVLSAAGHKSCGRPEQPGGLTSRSGSVRSSWSSSNSRCETLSPSGIAWRRASNSPPRRSRSLPSYFTPVSSPPRIYPGAIQERRFSVLKRIAPIALLVLAAVAAPAGAATTSGPYVALGDSYTSAPIVPFPTGNPILCGRSTNNYPQIVRRTIAPSTFTDASCGGATTGEMLNSQDLYGLQTAPPQFAALSANDTLVTLGIGGNDAGLVGIAIECGELDAFMPTGTACKDHYAAGGSDPNIAKIAATGPKVAAAIQGIHARAPLAQVLVVGYPDGLPVNGTSCWPLVPLSKGDIAYFNTLEESLNTVLVTAANANGATFVDTFTSSIEHDACKLPGQAWVNGIAPNSIAFPLHPNAMGEQSMAKQVLAALGSG